MRQKRGLLGIVVLLMTTLTCVTTAQSQQKPSQAIKTLKIDVDLVIAAATVTTPDGRFVTGLEKEDFKIAEDKIGQEITYFSAEDVPLSVGIIFDVSGSMKDKMKTAVEAALTFMKSGSPDDEYFLVPFADKPQETTEFTNDIAKIQSRLSFSKAKGRTALYDAVYLGLDMVEEGGNTKKALLLITDGEDNRSRYTFSNVKEYVKEKDVQIYAIGINSGFGDNGIDGRSVLQDLASITGGTAHFPPSIMMLEDICHRIALELKNQYVIGYHSSNTAKDGKWRKIQVKAEHPGQRLNVRAKTGYYAPSLDSKAEKD
jgi:Ca-activated chloride channel family protein